MALLRCPEVGREGQVSAHRLGMAGGTCGHRGQQAPSRKGLASPYGGHILCILAFANYTSQWS